MRISTLVGRGLIGMVPLLLGVLIHGSWQCSAGIACISPVDIHENDLRFLLASLIVAALANMPHDYLRGETNHAYLWMFSIAVGLGILGGGVLIRNTVSSWAVLPFIAAYLFCFICGTPLLMSQLRPRRRRK